MDWSEYDLGPAMQACSERERLFVWNYVTDETEDATAAARAAGYTDTGTGAIRVTAHRVLHRERVVAAIAEVSQRLFQNDVAIAVKANRAMLRDSKHPDHNKAVQATLSRLGLAEKFAVEHTHSGSVDVNHTDAALEHLRWLIEMQVPEAKLVEVFGFSGLSRYRKMLAEAPKTIEHRPHD